MKIYYYYFIIITTFLSISSIVYTQLVFPPQIDSAPPDLANNPYFHRRWSGNLTDYDCAQVSSIFLSNDKSFYEITIDVTLDGRGCYTELPFYVAPITPNYILKGNNALSSCNVDEIGCQEVYSQGILIAMDPPIYSSGLTTISGKSVPFGNLGYFSVDQSLNGVLDEFNYQNLQSNPIITTRTQSHMNVAMSLPPTNCQNSVSLDAFASNFSAKLVTANIYAAINPSYLTANSLQNMVTALLTSANTDTFHSVSVSPGILEPFGYVNLSSILGIKNPYVCSNNTLLHNYGALLHEIHTYPIPSVIWDSIIPDVVLPNNTYITFYGPQVFGYQNYIHDGAWLVPNIAGDSLPTSFMRSTIKPDASGIKTLSNINYAARHMPFNLQFGPTCSPLIALNPKMNQAIGGYVSLLGTTYNAGMITQYIDNEMLISMPYGISSGNSTMIASIYISQSPDVSFVDDMLFVLCNGMDGAVSSAGFDNNIQQRVGPLTSLISNMNSPIWSNPYWEFFNDGCPLCNPTTFRHQKGWTFASLDFWNSATGNECGKFNSDHLLFERILSLINQSNIPIADTVKLQSIFGYWNQSSAKTDWYLDYASALNIIGNVTNYPNILNSFIQGIGTIDWVKLIGDAFLGGCRTSGTPSTSFGTTNQQPQSLIGLLAQQFYAQAMARNSSLPFQAQSTSDLLSSSKAGVFNTRLPNIWFGIDQSNTTQATWNVYVEDSFDQTKNNIRNAKNGIAPPTQVQMSIRVPVSSVQIPMTNPGFGMSFVIDYTQTNCLCSSTANPACSNMVFKSKITFSSSSSTVSYLSLNITSSFLNTMINPQTNWNTMLFTIQHQMGQSGAMILDNTWTQTYDATTQTLTLNLLYNSIRRIDSWTLYLPFKTGNQNINAQFLLQLQAGVSLISKSLATYPIILSGKYTSRSISCQFNNGASGYVPQFSRNALPFYYDGSYGDIKTCGPKRGLTNNYINIPVSFGFISQNMIYERMTNTPINTFTYQLSLSFQNCDVLTIPSLDILQNIIVNLNQTAYPIVNPPLYFNSNQLVYQTSTLPNNQYITLYVSIINDNVIQIQVTYNENWFTTTNMAYLTNMTMNIVSPFSCNRIAWQNTTITSIFETFYTIRHINNQQSGIGEYTFISSDYSGTYQCADLFDDKYENLTITDRITIPNTNYSIILNPPLNNPQQSLNLDTELESGASFYQITVDPFEIPIQSICTPIYDRNALTTWYNNYGINDTVDDGMIIIDPNFKSIITYVCQIPVSADPPHNLTQIISICTVYPNGTRVGDHCYYYEDILNDCVKWYKPFVCNGIITSGQMMFLIFIFAIFASLIIIIVYVIFDTPTKTGSDKLKTT